MEPENLDQPIYASKKYHYYVVKTDECLSDDSLLDDPNTMQAQK